MIRPPRPTSTALEKERLQVRKLRVDILFVKLTFVAQIANTIGLASVGALAFFYFQRPQLEQMEINRLATEKQQVSALATSALALANPQDRASMLDAVHALYPQYEFLDSLARSQTVLIQVASPQPKATAAISGTAEPTPIASPSPSASLTPTPRSRDDDNLMEVKKRQLEELEARIADVDEICRMSSGEIEKLQNTLRDLQVATEKELGASADSRKPGRAPAYQSLYKQGVIVKTRLEESRKKNFEACSYLKEVSSARQRTISEIDEILRRTLR